MKKPSITIKKNESNPEPMELIANSIIEISNGFKKLKDSSLDQRVILLLIKDITGISLYDIQRVLDAAISLEDKYIKKKK